MYSRHPSPGKGPLFSTGRSTDSQPGYHYSNRPNPSPPHRPTSRPTDSLRGHDASRQWGAYSSSHRHEVIDRSTLPYPDLQTFDYEYNSDAEGMHGTPGLQAEMHAPPRSDHSFDRHVSPRRFPRSSSPLGARGAFEIFSKFTETQSKSDNTEFGSNSGQRNHAINSALRLFSHRDSHDRRGAADASDQSAHKEEKGFFKTLTGIWDWFIEDDYEIRLAENIKKLGASVKNIGSSVSSFSGDVEEQRSAIESLYRRQFRFPSKDVAGKFTLKAFIIWMLLSALIYVGIDFFARTYHMFNMKVPPLFGLAISVSMLKMFRISTLGFFLFSMLFALILSHYEVEGIFEVDIDKLKNPILFNAMHRCLRVGHGMTLFAPFFVLNSLEQNCFQNGNIFRCRNLMNHSSEILHKFDLCLERILKDERYITKNEVVYYTNNGPKFVKVKKPFEVAMAESKTDMHKRRNTWYCILWQRTEEFHFWEAENRANFIKAQLWDKSEKLLDYGLDGLVKLTGFMVDHRSYHFTFALWAMRLGYNTLYQKVVTYDVIKDILKASPNRMHYEGFDRIQSGEVMYQQIYFPDTNSNPSLTHFDPSLQKYEDVSIVVEAHHFGIYSIPKFNNVASYSHYTAMENTASCPTAQDFLKLGNLNFHQCPSGLRVFKQLVEAQYGYLDPDACPINCLEQLVCSSEVPRCDSTKKEIVEMRKSFIEERENYRIRLDNLTKNMKDMSQSCSQETTSKERYIKEELDKIKRSNEDLIRHYDQLKAQENPRKVQPQNCSAGMDFETITHHCNKHVCPSYCVKNSHEYCVSKPYRNEAPPDPVSQNTPQDDSPAPNSQWYQMMNDLQLKLGYLLKVSGEPTWKTKLETHEQRLNTDQVINQDKLLSWNMSINSFIAMFMGVNGLLCLALLFCTCFTPCGGYCLGCLGFCFRFMDFMEKEKRPLPSSKAKTSSPKEVVVGSKAPSRSESKAPSGTTTPSRAASGRAGMFTDRDKQYIGSKLIAFLGGIPENPTESKSTRSKSRGGS